VVGFCEDNNETSDPLNCLVFLNQLRNYQLLKDFYTMELVISLVPSKIKRHF
jgi:hypothetical protein